MEQKRAGIRRRLEADLKVRGSQLSVETMWVASRHMGGRPLTSPKGCGMGPGAAARLEQHRVAFSITHDERPLGPAPELLDDTYAASYRGAAAATEALRARFNRELDRSSPEIDDGLSL